MIHAPPPTDIPVRTPSGTFPNPLVVPPPVRGGLGDRSTSSGSAMARNVSGDLDRASLARLGQAMSQAVPHRPTVSVSSIDIDKNDTLFSALDSVVKVLVTFRDPDYSNPWQSMGVESSTGSGVAIETEAGLRILSAAHVVANQTFLQVQRTGVEDREKYVAHVHAVCHDSDLALLSIESETFWKNLKPIPLAANPPIRSLVLVAGFPVGGQELSVTEGVVSRIESQRYSHSGRELLAATVDAAINPGSSGGPAFNEKGELIGIAFQSMTGANGGGPFQISIQTIGHIILPTVIQKFLDGIARFGPKNYLGFPWAGIDYQPLTNPHLRKLFKLEDAVIKDAVSGVLITAVVYESSCYGVLKEKDILTHVDGKQVANNGTIALEGRYGRINMPTEFTMHQCGDKVPIRFIRDGKPHPAVVTLRPMKALALKEYDKDPQYFIWCGIVFQTLTIDYLREQEGASSYLVHLAQSPQLLSESEREAVVISRTLSDSVNVGYEDLDQQRIRYVNGEKIKDLQDLVNKIEKATDRPLVDIETWEGHAVILPSPIHPDAAAANERILKQYRVAKDRNLN